MAYLTELEITQLRDRMATAVLPHLPRGPWAWEPGGASHYGMLRREPDRLGLSLSLDTWKRRARFRVQGPPRRMSYACGLRDYGLIPYDQPEPACTVALDRSGDAVARDVARKVLAIADPLWPAVLAKVEEEEEHMCARDRTAMALARLTNAEPSSRGGDHRLVAATVAGVWLVMEVGPGGHVTLPQLNLTGPQMEAVIVALRGCGAGEEA